MNWVSSSDNRHNYRQHQSNHCWQRSLAAKKSDGDFEPVGHDFLSEGSATLDGRTG